MSLRCNHSSKIMQHWILSIEFSCSFSFTFFPSDYLTAEESDNSNMIPATGWRFKHIIPSTFIRFLTVEECRKANSAYSIVPIALQLKHIPHLCHISLYYRFNWISRHQQGMNIDFIVQQNNKHELVVLLFLTNSLKHFFIFLCMHT